MFRLNDNDPAGFHLYSDGISVTTSLNVPFRDHPAYLLVTVYQLLSPFETMTELAMIRLR